MKRAPVIAGATAAGCGVLVWGRRRFGADSMVFAFLVVWVPMTWLGTVSRVATPRLPLRCHELRTVERDGRVYEVLGVRAAKRLLRRGPLAVFNPGLHLPADRTPEQLADLEQRMKDAEASHAWSFLASSAVIVSAATRRSWRTAGTTLLFNVLLNGYPIMLQRYNRALLHRRFPAALASKPKTPARGGSG